MAIEQPSFDDSGKCFLKSFLGERVILMGETWNFKKQKTSQPLLSFNYDKIKATLLYPDHKRESSKRKGSLLCYKKFKSIHISANATMNTPPHFKYLAVVIRKYKKVKSRTTWIISTFYLTDRIKAGQEIG